MVCSAATKGQYVIVLSSWAAALSFSRIIQELSFVCYVLRWSHRNINFCAWSGFFDTYPIWSRLFEKPSYCANQFRRRCSSSLIRLHEILLPNSRVQRAKIQMFRTFPCHGGWYELYQAVERWPRVASSDIRTQVLHTLSELWLLFHPQQPDETTVFLSAISSGDNVADEIPKHYGRPILTQSSDMTFRKRCVQNYSRCDHR